MSWNHIAARDVAKTIKSYVETNGTYRILEIHPGVGVFYEALKLNLEHASENVKFEHIGVGTQHYKRQYEFMHGVDYHGAKYLTEEEGIEFLNDICHHVDLVVYNGAEANTHQYEQLINLEKIVSFQPKRLLVTSWIANHPLEIGRTTIKRRVVQLPVLAEVTGLLQTLRENSAPVGKCYEGIFSKFFLPEPEHVDGRVSLLVAYAGPDPQFSQDFSVLD